MFRSIGLFKNIPCPNIINCTLSNCFFSHEEPAITGNSVPASNTTSTPAQSHQASIILSDDIQVQPESPEQPNKRRKLSHDESLDINSAKPDDALDHPAPVEKQEISPTHEETISRKPDETVHKIGKSHLRESNSTPPVLKSALKKNNTTNLAVPRPPEDVFTTKTSSKTTPTRPNEAISVNVAINGVKSTPTRAPPTKTPSATKSRSPQPNATTDTSSVAKAETLVPRGVPNPPAQFTVRLQMLTALHDELVRLNPAASSSAAKQALVIQAVKEEETCAKENNKTYGVVMKNRIFTLKKMSVEKYQEERVEKLKEAERNREPVVIETTLSEEDEIRALSGLVHSFDALQGYSYVLIPPSTTELEEVRAGLQAAAGYEECDRCKSRFRVFPGRRQEDGALASGGTCVYHWGKPLFQEKAAGSAEKVKKWECCQEDMGVSTGCTTAQTHVFNVRSSKRLAALWQFMETPEDPVTDSAGNDKEKLKAVCLDCEMSYTTQGLELVRVTATEYPSYKLVLDVLVRPFGELLDANTRFSGVTAQQLANAQPYSQTATPTENTLTILPSPAAARHLLFSLINRETILIGHALDNDVNTLRIIHPRVIDTAILFPHRRGPPIRNALKWLVRKFLARNIQTAGKDGHDSREDANGAGDLVRYKISQAVKAKRIDENGLWVKLLPEIKGEKPRIKLVETAVAMGTKDANQESKQTKSVTMTVV